MNDPGWSESYLDAKLVLEGDGETMQRSHRLAVLGDVLIQLFGTGEGQFGEELVTAIDL
jgi:hypothetical protein